MTIQTLPKDDLQELTATLKAWVDESGDQLLYRLRILKLLLEGSPLSPEQIASRLQITQDEVAALLRGTERDQEGNVVGWGVSLVPTPHSYQVNGRQFYVWCAGDAITFPIFHKTSAVIESPDPISGEKVRLIATPAGAREVKPSTAVISHVSRTESLENVRAWGCDFMHFFTSVKTASQYVAKHPGLVILPIDEVFQLWQRVWDREPYKSLIADL